MQADREPRLKRRTVLAGAAAAIVGGSHPTMAQAATHIVLLGDSILDNAAYVPPGEEVLGQLGRMLPAGVRTSLLAQDGAVIAHVLDQLRQVPQSATHLVISAGGNDALQNSGVLRAHARSTAEALAQVSDIRDRFRASYSIMLDNALALGLPTLICTIYDARLPDAVEARLAATALTALNDVITREATIRRLPVLDLRVLFDDPADYANSIEPSGQGGSKIAALIARIVAEHDFAGPATLYGRV